MKEFEVLVREIPDGLSWTEEQEALNKFSDFEFVGVLPLHGCHRVYFKREKPKPSEKSTQAQNKSETKPVAPRKKRKDRHNCGCMCHCEEMVKKYGPTTHGSAPCRCSKCQFCGQNIEKGDMEAHIKQEHTS